MYFHFKLGCTLFEMRKLVSRSARSHVNSDILTQRYLLVFELVIYCHCMYLYFEVPGTVLVFLKLNEKNLKKQSPIIVR